MSQTEDPINKFCARLIFIFIPIFLIAGTYCAIMTPHQLRGGVITQIEEIDIVSYTRDQALEKKIKENRILFNSVIYSIHKSDRMD